MDSATARFVVLKLKPGWALAADGRAVARRGRRVAPALPDGAALQPALPLPPTPRPTAGERELRRFVHLHLPARLALARGWEFVERAEEPAL